MASRNIRLFFVSSLFLTTVLFARIKPDYQKSSQQYSVSTQYSPFASEKVDRTSLLNGTVFMSYFGERLENFFSPYFSMEGFFDYLNLKTAHLTGAGKFAMDFYFFSIGVGPVVSATDMGILFYVRIGLYMESNLAWTSYWVGASFKSKIKYQHRLFDNFYFSNVLQYRIFNIIDYVFQEVQYLTGVENYFFDSFLFSIRGGANFDANSYILSYTAQVSLGFFFQTSLSK